MNAILTFESLSTLQHCEFACLSKIRISNIYMNSKILSGIGKSQSKMWRRGRGEPNLQTNLCCNFHVSKSPSQSGQQVGKTVILETSPDIWLWMHRRISQRIICPYADTSHKCIHLRAWLLLRKHHKKKARTDLQTRVDTHSHTHTR